MTLAKDNTTGVLKISGTLDIGAANPLREALLEFFLHQPDVTADLSAVDKCDTAALQVLLAGKRNAASLGKTLRLTGLSNSITETAAALGFSLDRADNPIGESHEVTI